jgi:thiol-disulfide isomerase/thioredoxin
MGAYGQVQSSQTLKIIAIKPEPISDKVAKINVMINQKAQCQIEYGKTLKYGSLSAKEKSFKYSNHSLTLTKLSPLTRYHYRVHVWDKAGNQVTSGDNIVTSLKPAVPYKGTLHWLTDYDLAIKQAKRQHKRIFVLFTGSDWCPPCMRLEKNVLSTHEFGKYLDANYILLVVDFPRKKELSLELRKHNKKLAKKYDIHGFPTILILDTTGNKIAKTRHKPNSRILINAINRSLK